MKKITRVLLVIWIGTLFSACVAPPLPMATPTPAPVEQTGPAWWHEAVFYEIFVRSFYDSNSDGIGDLNGITAKLDYLNDGDPNTTNDLGVTGLWLMPIHPSPSYHGYDVTNYFDVNPDYGTLTDFKRLLAEAHKRGIRIIIDLVVNHTSREHPWFVHAEGANSSWHDWYRWSATDPHTIGPWGQQVWHPAPNGEFYYGVFWEGMPDLNYKNPAVVAELDTIMRFWLELGIDGFRVDGARYMVEDGNVLADSAGTHAFFRHVRQFVKSVNPNAMTVGEVWTSNDAVATYAQGDEFDLLFNFDLAGGLVNSARQNNAGDALSQLALSNKFLTAQHSAPFLTNHDQNRVMVELGGDVNKAKRAATLLLTAPGTPFLYYGEEIGQVGQKPDEDIRLPMQWSNAANAGFTTEMPWRAPAADFDWKNVAAQAADNNSLLAHYKAALAVRNANPALRAGDGFKVTSGNGAVLPLLRADDEQTILVVTNLSENGVGDYRLQMENGPLEPGATYSATPIWGQAPMAGFTATSDGGFANYQPSAGLSPGETIIVVLKK
jgi:alpha-amylase